VVGKVTVIDAAAKGETSIVFAIASVTVSGAEPDAILSKSEAGEIEGVVRDLIILRGLMPYCAPFPTISVEINPAMGSPLKSIIRNLIISRPINSNHFP
jgi:hypothetical protein